MEFFNRQHLINMAAKKFPILISFSIFLSSLLISACTRQEAQISFEKVLTAGLEHILVTEHLAPEYYNIPLKIIRPDKYPIRSSILVNGKECILLPANTDKFDVLQGMDIFKPVPLIIIFNYKHMKDSTYIEISFPATGPVYEITLDGDDDSGYKVKTMTSYVT